MKIKIIRSKFLEGLKKVQNIVASKGSLQIIQNVLLETKENQLFLTTTDLDISIRSVVPCEVEEQGSTTLPVKLLFNTIAKAQEGQVELAIDENDHAVISAGSALFEIDGMSVVDFPALPKDGDSFAYVVPQGTLRDMLRKTSYAASQDDTRKTLKGVLASFNEGKLTMVATDGRRLALIDHEVEFPANAARDIVLPTKLVTELSRDLEGTGDARITVEGSQVAFDLGDTQIYSKLLDEVYPNYRQVIPGALPEHVIVDRKLLLDALDRASVMTQDESNSVRLIFEANMLTVTSAADKGKARDTVTIKYAGERIEIIFNPGFVMDPLKAIDDDVVKIELNNGSSPAILKSSDSFLYVMMPLRIN